MKPSKICISLSIPFLMLSMAACSTVPTATLKPSQTEFYKMKFKNQKLPYVKSVLGEPATQGHWGNAESRFVLQYVETTEAEATPVPRWSAKAMKEKWNCYNFMFDKEHGDVFEDVYRENCNGGYAPQREDFDYPPKK